MTSECQEDLPKFFQMPKCVCSTTTESNIVVHSTYYFFSYLIYGLLDSSYFFRNLHTKLNSKPHEYVNFYSIYTSTGFRNRTLDTQDPHLKTNIHT